MCRLMSVHADEDKKILDVLKTVGVGEMGKVPICIEVVQE